MHFETSKCMKLLLFSLFGLHFQRILVTADDLPIIRECYNSSNYTSGSIYERNLNTIVHSLCTNEVPLRQTFYEATYGDYPNTIYVCFQCMSEASEADCRQCLFLSLVQIFISCPKRKQATILYYYCILRYSNQSLLSHPDNTVRLRGGFPIPVLPTKAIIEEIGALIKDASASSSRIRTMVTRVSNPQIRLYGMAQCTRDLSGNDCYTCLLGMARVIERIPFGLERYISSLSCNIKYDDHPFYDLSESPSPLVARDALPPSQENKVKERNFQQGEAKKQQIVLIIVLLVAIVIFMSISYNYLQRKKRGHTGMSVSYVTGRPIRTEFMDKGMASGDQVNGH